MKKSIMRIRLTVWIMMVLILGSGVRPWAQPVTDPLARIVVDPTPRGRVPPLFFGAAMTEWPVTRIDARYGWGLWDPDRKLNPPEPIAIGRGAGLKTLRLLGMWEKWEEGLAIPGSMNTNKLPFGVDEWMRTCEEMGVEPVFCLDYIYESTDEFVNLIHYLNDSADAALLLELERAGLDEASRVKLYDRFGRDAKDAPRWGNLRALNGHPKPYCVKFVEVGNESYLYLPVDQYIKQYLAFYRDLKAADPALQVGVVLGPPVWNEVIAHMVGNNMDFGVVHFYATPYMDLTRETAQTCFVVTVALPELEGNRYITECSNILKAHLGRSVPLAITEFNTGFCGPSDPWAHYQHALGTGLANAEILRVFMAHGTDILTANCFTFVNGYNGMVSNGFNWTQPAKLHDPYWKRPNYYAYEFYRRYFGDMLLKAEVICDGYDLERYIEWLGMYRRSGRATGANLVADQSWKFWEPEGVRVETGEVLRLTFSDPPVPFYFHASKGCAVEPGAWYRASCLVKTDRLNTWGSDPGIRLEVGDDRGWDKAPWIAYTEGLKGSIDWVYVEKVFRTLPDAKGILVLARISANHLPLNGTVYVRDVAVHRIIPDPFPQLPYLAVNASLSHDGRTVYLIIVNRNMEQSVPADIAVRDMPPTGPVRIHTLWAERVDATNENPPHDSVTVRDHQVDTRGKALKTVFPSHSLTAIEWPVK